MILPRTSVMLLATAAVLLVLGARLHGEENGAAAIRDDFESARPVWRQEQTDATVNLLAHERTKRAAHEGRNSERFHFVAGIGSAFYYSYPLPKLPVTDELRAEVFVRSNRAGIRLYGRVVLPRDTDPDTGQPSYVMIAGTAYENTDRWQRIGLTGLRPAIERQARVLRAATRRPVSLEGAYLERLVINLFGGVGETEVFLDDLIIAPVAPQAIAAGVAAPPAEPEKAEAPGPEKDEAPLIKFDGDNRLVRKGRDGRYYDWVFTAIEAPEAEVAELRRHGFDVLAERADAEPRRAQDAVRRGFFLLPNLDGTLEGHPIDANRMVATASSYPFREAVAFWNVGDRLGRAPDLDSREEELDRIRNTIAGLRKLPPGVSHLTAASVDGELPLFARAPKNLAILGIRPNCWGSAQDPLELYVYLKQRRELTALSNPGALFFAWLPATPPASVQASIWGEDTPPSWGMPQVQPEQLRLFTYVALAAGYRGLAFQGNSELTHDAGRPLLIEMSLLNEEIDLCESILANGSDPIVLHNTYLPDPPTLPPPGSSPMKKIAQLKENPPHPSIRAAAIGTRDRKGFLLLVADLSPGAQYQPGQMAIDDIKITVPSPQSAQAFEISPGNVQALERQRVPGGTRITLKSFDTTSLILLTTDVGLAERLHEQIRRVRPMAVQMAIEQARLQLRLVNEVTDRLIADGHTLYDPNDPKNPPRPEGSLPPNDEALLRDKATEMIKVAQEALENADYPLAWSEARRCGRALRHLMFAQWQKAHAEMVKVVDPELPKPPPSRRGRQNLAERKAEQDALRNKTPVLLLPLSSPPLVAYNTLPQHYLWIDWMRRPFGPNLVPSGSFDDHTALEEEGWLNQSYQLQGIRGKVMTVADPDQPGNRWLKMTVEPAEKKKLDELAPFLDFPAAAIRTPPVRVAAGQFVRISVLVKKPGPNPPGQGGLLVTDSISGEPLQFRQSGSITKFSRVVLFRRAPADGVVSVTLGLAGVGEAYFDDFRLETVSGSAPDPRDEFAGPRPRDRNRAPAPTTARRPFPGSRSSR